jgi:hypothetical protein
VEIDKKRSREVILTGRIKLYMWIRRKPKKSSANVKKERERPMMSRCNRIRKASKDV